MQLRFIPPVFLSGAGLKQSLSAILTGMTAVGTITAVALNVGNSSSSIAEYLGPLRKALISDTLLGGINKLGSKFYSWGSSILGLKDAFKEWVHSYLNPSGLKAGAVALYKKLYDWANIVYNWFATKFIEFLGNIPEMVKNWDKLRLSLFKWGTFLGGGGGAALFAMFGSGENWGKLQELMGREDFGEMMSTLSDLIEKNDEAFNSMGEEELKEIIDKYLEDPKEAHEAAKELLEKQKEMADKAKEDQKKAELEGKEQEDKEQKEPQLEKQEIEEAFSTSKGGKPQSKSQVFGNMIGEALNKLVETKHSFFEGVDVYKIARQQMNEYLTIIKSDVEKEKRRNQKETAKQKFLDSLKDNKKEELLVNALARVTKKAYDSKFPTNLEVLKQAFVDSFNSSFTKTCNDGDAGCGKVNFDAKSINTLPKRKH